MNQRFVWPTQRENQCVKAMKGNWRTIIIQPSFSSFCQSCFCRRYSFQRFSTHFSEIDVCIHQLFVKVNLPQFSKSTASWNLRFCDFHWISKLPMLRAAHCCPISQIEQTNNTLCQQRNNERVPQPWQRSSRGTISTWSRDLVVGTNPTDFHGYDFQLFRPSRYTVCGLSWGCFTSCCPR
jgi:hypothetical protein